MAKLSVSLPDELVEQIGKAADGSRYRNKSHLVQVAVEKLLEHESGEDKADGVKHINEMGNAL
jgi:Ribbon-helix-helix protein, copG family.